MQNKESFVTTLIIIYLALVFLVGVAVYALIIHFCLDIALATNILIWSATLFPSIALLYTFSTWRDQKATDTLSTLSKEYYLDLNQLFKEIQVYAKQFVNHIPIVEVNISILKELGVFEKKVEEFGYKLNFIYKETNNIKLFNEIEKIDNLIQLLRNIVNDAIPNQEELKEKEKDPSKYQMYKIKIVDQSYKIFNEEFDSFKKEIDTILMDYIFYKNN